MEIIMVLISTTLACVFVGLQLYHVKKHPNVLPFISVFMMSILTLGHMIPVTFGEKGEKSREGKNQERLPILNHKVDFCENVQSARAEIHRSPYTSDDPRLASDPLLFASRVALVVRHNEQITRHSELISASTRFCDLTP
ncbi:DUF2921 family protein [Medicago truncatula]|uniref:RING-type E3 ubiquitin transferase n=1 Tax=Medicago truncatula TaxID=3880 RepID=G7JIL7_MEDTR|nr:DUF2921 family protein [Medicago truncatula]